MLNLPTKDFPQGHLYENTYVQCLYNVGFHLHFQQNKFATFKKAIIYGSSKDFSLNVTYVINKKSICKYSVGFMNSKKVKEKTNQIRL